jgi:hypothetical protein
VNLRCAMRSVPPNFLRCALFDALAGESSIRNLRLKYLEELCARAGNAEDLENLSTTPVVDDSELLQDADFDLSGRVGEARAALRKALREAHKLDGLLPCAGAPVPSKADSQ